jgi:hypothetical protein
MVFLDSGPGGKQGLFEQPFPLDLQRGNHGGQPGDPFFQLDPDSWSVHSAPSNSVSPINGEPHEAQYVRCGR